MKKTIFLFTILFGIFSFTNILFSQELKSNQRKMTIAVINFEAIEGISYGEARSLSDAFSAQLIRSREFTVVDRNTIQAILTEQGFQQSEACSNVECVTEVGKILKAEQIVFGRIGKVGRVFNITIQMVNVTSAQVLFTSNKAFVGNIEDLLLEIIPSIVEEMVKELTGKEIELYIPLESSKEPMSIGLRLGFSSISALYTYTIKQFSHVPSNFMQSDMVEYKGYSIGLSANLVEILKNVIINPEIFYAHSSLNTPENVYGYGGTVSDPMEVWLVPEKYDRYSVNCNFLINFPTRTIITPLVGILLGYNNTVVSYTYSYLNSNTKSILRSDEGHDSISNTEYGAIIGLKCAILNKSFLSIQIRYIADPNNKMTMVLGGINYIL